ncbi:MAG: PaaI family thioesterase, partial [Candidatus Poseidoniia archaeon]
LNKGGVAHGGLHATMLDTALGGALVSALRKEEWCATAQLDLSYLDPAYSGSHLYAHGRVIRKGRNIAHLEGEIVNQDGKTIATGKGTWAIWVNRPKSLGGSE